MHTSFEDPTNSTEVATEMAIVGVMNAARSLDEYRDDPDAYRTMRNNAADIKAARDRLSDLLQQIGRIA